MSPRKKLVIVSAACAAIVMGLLLSGILFSHLLANREMVKSFLVTKTARLTGGTLEYGRLDVTLFPHPHVTARNIQLRRPGMFRLRAHELSVYPRILPILTGRFSIHRLELVRPDINIRTGSQPAGMTIQPHKTAAPSLDNRIREAIGNFFTALEAIDPDTDLRIKTGSVTLVNPDMPDFEITAINALASSKGGSLSWSLQCRSDLSGELRFSGRADSKSLQASGQVTMTGIDMRPLLYHASLPGGIISEKTRATLKADVTIDGPEKMDCRFDLQMPTLTVLRKHLKLNLDTASVAGRLEYTDKILSLTVDSLRSKQPALDFSANARIYLHDDTGKPAIEVHAAANSLDVAVAGEVARAIAGDLNAIRTAFSVARKGLLSDATYFAGLEIDDSGMHLKKMTAAGHLSRGVVTIPGITVDLKQLNGDVVLEGSRVEFKRASGRFKGVDFQQLDATIDWAEQATLSIASPSATVDMEPLFAWLTEFEDLSGVNTYIESIEGTGRLTTLRINGPLTDPANWHFEISGTPEDMRVVSPLVPFEIKLSGGEFSYVPGKERATGVRFAFLDGSLVTSYQSTGIIDPESIALRMDGSMGPEAIAWLTTILPIPGHLQMKPPVNLSDVNIVLSDTRTLSFMGAIKTAGGVELVTDFTATPRGWHIRRIQFADGHSKASASARKHPDGLEVNFSGNIEKTTADRLLENNRTLLGRLEGDFRTVIDTREPRNSLFTGKLSGQGLQIHSLLAEPIDVEQFSIEGQGNRLKVGPSKVSTYNSALVVNGVLDNQTGGLTFDLNVDADRLDTELIAAIRSIGNKEPDAEQKPKAPLAPAPRGTVRVKATDFSYNGMTWSPVEADIRMDGENVNVRVIRANLCGISTPGELAFSPRGMRLQATPTAKGVSLQETAGCVWNMPVKAEARYDLTGEIMLPPTREDPIGRLSGQMEVLSENGRIYRGNLLMKIFSVLNVTELLTGEKSDLRKDGYGYTKAYMTAEIGGGKLHLNEILLDGNSLKISGQGSIDLKDKTVDIILLAAPLKTIDRIVDKLPVINYITGGSLISIPIRLEGEISDIKVVPMAPSDVGQGLLNIMGRVLKAPFNIVDISPEASPTDTTQKDR